MNGTEFERDFVSFSLALMSATLKDIKGGVDEVSSALDILNVSNVKKAVCYFS